MENTENTTSTDNTTETSTATEPTNSSEAAAPEAAGEKTASKRVVSKGKKTAGAATASKRTSKKAAAAEGNGRKLVTATLPKRQVRVLFMQGSKKVAESPVYNSANTIEKIVAYAKRQLGAAKIGEAKAKAQESTDGKKWNDVKMPAAQTVNA